MEYNFINHRLDVITVILISNAYCVVQQVTEHFEICHCSKIRSFPWLATFNELFRLFPMPGGLNGPVDSPLGVEIVNSWSPVNLDEGER